jgi:hypothetical protein
MAYIEEEQAVFMVKLDLAGWSVLSSKLEGMLENTLAL